MRLRQLADRYRQAINPNALLDLARSVAIDRLQGSHGLARAADLVAEHAAAAGLHVTVTRHRPGTPAARWWGFTAPRARSPVSAALYIGSEPEPLASYADNPLTLARGSASTPPTGLRAPLIFLPPGEQPLANMRGAFIVISPTPRFKIYPFLEALAAAGAIGVGIEAAPRAGTGADRIDRLEVPDDCPLVALSLSAEQARRLRAAGPGTTVTVHADHEPAADMPVVHATLPGAGNGPAGLLIAHLCHPGPGADDNASGVATLLGIGAAALSVHPSTRPRLELLWAPEMVGTAAWLHHRLHTTPDRLPDFVISVDMVGADPDLSGGILTIERTADHVPSPVAAALDAAADAADPPVVSYSEAVTGPAQPRMVVPFVGASDRLLFSDPAIGIPGAHLSCGPSRLHHSSYDTPSTLSSRHLHRHAIITATAAAALCTGTGIEGIVAAMRRLDLTRLITTAADMPDPYALPAARTAVEGGYDTLTRWHPAASLAAARTRQTLRGIAERLQPAASPPPRLAAEPTADSIRSSYIPERQWEGPWNLHNLLADLDAPSRAKLGALLDGGGSRYAAAVAFAFTIDGRKTLHQLQKAASAASGMPISTEFIHGLAEAMSAAGWISYRPAT